jgi:hypothetical protein
MSTSAPTVPSQEPLAPLSEPQRLANTFIAPSKTFADLKQKPGWWVPWLLLALLSFAVAYLVERKVGYDRVVETSLKMAPKRAESLDRLPADERERQLSLHVHITQAAMYAGPLILLLIGILVAAVLMATLNFVAGSEIGFKMSLAVLFYSWLPPSVVKTLIAAISMMTPGFAPERFNIENPAATNLAGLMVFPPPSPALYKLAAAVDIFSIWTILLLGLGFSYAGNVKRSTATLVVAAWYVFATFVGVAWAALGM